jgi:amphi-Trp domain-containing protein
MAKKDGAKARSRAERFEVEESMSAHDVAGYLEGLARGLRDGTVVIGGETEGFHAVVAGEVDFEVDARRGKRKSRIELSLAFRSDTPEQPDESSEGSDGAIPETIPDEMSF